jgi:hypothetical protein
MVKLFKDIFSSATIAIAVAMLLTVAMPAMALNTAGDAVYASASVSDGTGVVTTVAAAGTYVTVGTAAPLAAGLADGSGCITYTLASNSFTVAKRCGVGVLLLKACLNDVVGTNSRTYTGAWHRVRAGVTSVVSPIMRDTEAASAVRDSQGCIEMLVDANQSDTYDFRYDSGTNGDTVTTRQAFFEVRKVLNK